MTLPVRNAPFTIQLPKYMPVKTTIDNTLAVDFNHVLNVTIPINQQILASLNEDITLDAALNTNVRLKTTIPFRASVPINTQFELLLPINDGAIPIHIPIKLPLAFNLPVDLEVPVNVLVPVNIKTHVSGNIDEVIAAELKTTLSSTVRLATELTTKVLTTLDARMTFPTTPTRLMVDNANLNLLIDDIELLPMDKNAQQQINPEVQRNPLAGFYYDAENQPPVRGQQLPKRINQPHH